eukprot:TRINITY_DN8414_c0_g1_i1.p1 TRINITY_DN8414_c0_g1~~TRINITY_DN8414_c0_g1_i1.p1  ORF type:complete len:748 (+),score=176.78 TRINITY_DN8414_c0_g1_i1:107-2350(+)
MFDEGGRGVLHQRELYDILKALAFPPCPAAALAAVGVLNKDASLDITAFKRMIHSQPFRDTLANAQNGKNAQYNLRVLEKAVDKLSSHAYTLDELRSCRLSFHIHEGTGLLPEVSAVKKAMWTAGRVLADKFLENWCTEFIRNGFTSLNLSEFLDLFALAAPRVQLERTVTVTTPRNIHPSAKTGLYDLADDAFLETINKRVAQKVNKDYIANQERQKREGADRMVKSTVVRQQQGRAHHTVKANLELYDEIKSALHNTKLQIVSSRAGGRVSNETRKEIAALRARGPTASPTSHRPVMPAKNYSYYATQLKKHPLLTRVEEEAAYRPQPTTVSMVNDANIEFDVPHSKEEIIRAQEEALDPSDRLPSYMPHPHICRPSDQEFFGDNEFTFRGAADIAARPPQHPGARAQSRVSFRPDGAGADRPGSQMSMPKVGETGQQTTQMPRAQSPAGDHHRSSASQSPPKARPLSRQSVAQMASRRPSAAYVEASRDKLEQYWNCVTESAIPQAQTQASRTFKLDSDLTGIMAQLQFEREREAREAALEEALAAAEASSERDDRTWIIPSMRPESRLLEMIEDHIDHMYDRPETAMAALRFSNDSPDDGLMATGQRMAMQPRSPRTPRSQHGMSPRPASAMSAPVLHLQQQQHGHLRPHPPQRAQSPSPLSPRYQERAAVDRLQPPTKPLPNAAQPALIRRVLHPNAAKAGVEFKRASMNMFRLSLDADGDLERRRLEATAAYSAARGAIKA